MTRDPDRCPGTPHRDRPRYRVLATPWYDHEHSGRYPADRCPPAGWELEVYRTDAHWLAAGGRYAHEPLGTTQLTDRTSPTLDLAAARATVVDWLHIRAAPRPTRVTPADVELYARLGDPPRGSP